jgi:hypothetical protein
VAIWYILRLFGIFFPFWYVVPRKIWQPWWQLASHHILDMDCQFVIGGFHDSGSEMVCALFHLPRKGSGGSKPGVDVMITIFANFRQEIFEKN